MVVPNHSSDLRCGSDELGPGSDQRRPLDPRPAILSHPALSPAEPEVGRIRQLTLANINSYASGRPGTEASAYWKRRRDEAWRGELAKRERATEGDTVGASVPTRTWRSVAHMVHVCSCCFLPLRYRSLEESMPLRNINYGKPSRISFSHTGSRSLIQDFG